MEKSNKSFDFTSIYNQVEKFSPLMARTVLMKALNVVIPFNAHLKTTLKQWSDRRTVVRIKLHRGVKNHLGSVHAGALFTLSESAAGILLIKNFNPNKYRLIMQSAQIEYFKQARSHCEAVCEISESKVAEIKKNIQAGQPFMVEMTTHVQNPVQENLCTLKTQWQIKPWDQVKKK